MFIDKDSLDYIVLTFILQNRYMSSISIQLNMNRILKTNYFYATIKSTIYRLRKKGLVQCYGQRWVATNKIKIICKLETI